MALLSPTPKQQFFDANGLPLAGGKIYTYAAGTTSNIATYVDSAGVTTNTNPIILDSQGMCNIWLRSTASYKYVVYDADDVLQFSTDNITVASSTSGGGATGGGGDRVFLENGTTITTSYTITSTYNAMSVGPITINSGAVITVPAGSVWLIF